MNKKQLIRTAAARSGYPQTVTARVLSAVINTIHESLDKADNVKLAGFGTFSVAEHKARRGHNPATNQPLDIPAKRLIRFRSNKRF